MGGILTSRLFQSGRAQPSVPLSLLLFFGGIVLEAGSLYFWRKQREEMGKKPRKIQKKPKSRGVSSQTAELHSATAGLPQKEDERQPAEQKGKGPDGPKGEEEIEKSE